MSELSALLFLAALLLIIGGVVAVMLNRLRPVVGRDKVVIRHERPVARRP